MRATDPHQPALFPTFPEFARELRCSVKLLRKARDAGELRAYRISGRWQRIYRPEGIAWARSKIVPPTNHAAARLAEVLEREARSGVADP